MLTSEYAAPRIEFDEWRLEFPDRGSRYFVARENPSEPITDTIPDHVAGMWLARAESGLAVVMPQHLRLSRGTDPIIGLAVLHHGQRIEFAGYEGRFAEVQHTVVSLGSVLLGRRCPLCRMIHRLGDELLRCPLCGAGYDLDCWADLVGRRCCSRNCRFSPATLVMPVS